MSGTPQEEFALQSIESETRAKFAREANDAFVLWERGVIALGRGIDSLYGHTAVSEDANTRALLLASAWGYAYCMFDLATRGFHLQALNMSRMLYETEVASLYLMVYPHKTTEFEDGSRSSMQVGKMLRSIIVDDPNVDQPFKDIAAKMKDTFQDIHKFSHVDTQQLLRIVSNGPNGYTVLRGPQTDTQSFREIAGSSIFQLRSLMNYMRVVLQQFGADQPIEIPDFITDATAWLTKETGITPSGSTDPYEWPMR